MKRREAIGGLGALAVLRALPVHAAPALPIVGFLGVASPAPFAHLVDAFREGLKTAGFAEDVGCRVEYRWAEGQFERLSELAAELLTLNVTAIAVSGGFRAAKTCQALTSTTPIVFSGCGDPIKEGLIADYARPGGNVTGVNMLTCDLDVKRLELLLELIPGVKRVAVLVNPGNRQTGLEREALLRQTGAAAGCDVMIVSATGAEDLEAAFTAMVQSEVGGLVVAADPVFFAQRKRVVGLAERARIPAVYEFREYADVGGLMSYGSNLAEAYRMLGTYVGQIVGGAKPGEMPVARSSKVELVLNLKTAEALGFTVPQPLLAQAVEIIE